MENALRESRAFSIFATLRCHRRESTDDEIAVSKLDVHHQKCGLTSCLERNTSSKVLIFQQQDDALFALDDRRQNARVREIPNFYFSVGLAGPPILISMIPTGIFLSANPVLVPSPRAASVSTNVGKAGGTLPA